MRRRVVTKPAEPRRGQEQDTVGRLEKLLAEGTPGPWELRSFRRGSGTHWYWRVYSPQEEWPGGEFYGSNQKEPRFGDDPALIVGAVNSLSALLAVAKAAQDVLEDPGSNTLAALAHYVAVLDLGVPVPEETPDGGGAVTKPAEPQRANFRDPTDANDAIDLLRDEMQQAEYDRDRARNLQREAEEERDDAKAVVVVQAEQLQRAEAEIERLKKARKPVSNRIRKVF